jgi:hypothetical protein
LHEDTESGDWVAAWMDDAFRGVAGIRGCESAGRRRVTRLRNETCGDQLLRVLLATLDRVGGGAGGAASPACSAARNACATALSSARRPHRRSAIHASAFPARKRRAASASSVACAFAAACRAARASYRRATRSPASAAQADRRAVARASARICCSHTGGSRRSRASAVRSAACSSAGGRAFRPLAGRRGFVDVGVEGRSIRGCRKRRDLKAASANGRRHQVYAERTWKHTADRADLALESHAAYLDANEEQKGEVEVKGRGTHGAALTTERTSGGTPANASPFRT